MKDDKKKNEVIVKDRRTTPDPIADCSATPTNFPEIRLQASTKRAWIDDPEDEDLNFDKKAPDSERSIEKEERLN